MILGNDTAVEAARAGHTNPWPDGTIFAKLVWKDRVHPDWKKATVPCDFVHAEVMFKNATKYTQTGGWGFARWVGLEQKPYGENATFVQECFGCHTPENTMTMSLPIPQFYRSDACGRLAAVILGI